jgi:hypothetical protein
MADRKRPPKNTSQPLGQLCARTYAEVFSSNRHLIHARQRLPNASSIDRCRAIAVLENALATAQDLLHRDDLTPLLNRRGFRRACDQSAATRTIQIRMCCVMMDLDDFKSINNRYGHPAGDAALVHFSQTLRRPCASSGRDSAPGRRRVCASAATYAWRRWATRAGAALDAPSVATKIWAWVISPVAGKRPGKSC